jgi:hypothetical protein
LEKESKMQQAIRAARADEVPVLDLGSLNSGGDLAPLARHLRHACETIGFFYVANHGIPAPIFDGVFAATRRYFDLPEAQRLTHRMDERFRRGFMPHGINQHPGYAPDLKESYEIGIDLPLTDPDVVAGLPLYGPIAGRRNAHGCGRRPNPISRRPSSSVSGCCACSPSASTCRATISCSSAPSR